MPRRSFFLSVEYYHLYFNCYTSPQVVKNIETIIGFQAKQEQKLPWRDRHDWEAQIMQQATDPQAVLNILPENLEQAEIELSQ